MLPAPGEELNLGWWVVGDEFVKEYLGAVEDSSPIYGEIDAVPPMALAARALGALLEELSLPPGTIHGAQELDCRRMVQNGEVVSCIARPSRPMRRGDWQFLTFDFTLYGANDEPVLSGKSTVLIPGQGMAGR